MPRVSLIIVSTCWAKATVSFNMYPDLKVAVLYIINAMSLATTSSGLSSTRLRSSLIKGCLGLISNAFFWLR